MNNSYYDTYYNLIIKNIFDEIEYNKNILLIVKDTNYLLDNLEFIIKKKNIQIKLLTNNDTKQEWINYILGSEMENNIKIYDDHNEILKNNIFFKYIILFQIETIQYFEDILNILSDVVDTDTLLYIYISLEKNDKIKYKNFIRENIIKYIDKKINLIFSYESILEKIMTNLFFKISSIKIYKKNNYLIYGNNTVYQIILIKK